MPELPEVETVCQGLHRHLNGQRIERVETYRPDIRYPIPQDLEERCAGAVITNVARRAKYILLSLETEDVLVIHLGMSGQLLYFTEEQIPLKHDHVQWGLADGAAVMFRDPRRFGFVGILPVDEMETHSWFAHLGPEPLSDEWMADALFAQCQRRSGPIKNLLMNQEMVVGIGNIYACEALFRSRIHPFISANLLSMQQCEALVQAVKDVLLEAIASGGSTLRDYVRSSGDVGYFQHQFAVYGRAEAQCLRCEAVIERQVLGGRSTFYCPSCQPACHSVSPAAA